MVIMAETKVIPQTSNQETIKIIWKQMTNSKSLRRSM